MSDDEKRPFIDLADLLILIGALLLLAGTFLFDYRLSVIVAGLLLLAAGSARLRRIER